MRVGGGGGNAINNMIAENLEGVEFIAANTDAQVLATSKASRRIQLGTTVTEGLGAGSLPDIGRAAAERSAERRVGTECGSTCRSGWSPYTNKKNNYIPKRKHHT